MLILRFLAFIGIFVLASEAAVLPTHEVESLKLIARTLGKTNWNFEVDPCSGESGWTTVNPTRGRENEVNCSCTFENNTVCHVVRIILKAQDLDGRLPPELVRLPFLQVIDLTRNYLNGSIPREWGSTKLVNINLLGNRLTGPIPEELASISTLMELVLEANQFSGTIPPQFGSHSRIDRLLLSSNNLTGELPNSLANLTTLTDFRISDNNFSGRIPDFIEKWINIEKIAIQASGLSGPIPSGVSSLTKLIDLRISDLNGDEFTFPLLNKSIRLDTLILRSCNIVGELPNYLGELKELKVLDLSFNKLSGPIPYNFLGLSKTDYVYLTGNSLNGPLPPWMLGDGDSIDLSYNNLTSEGSASSCQRGALNLFASMKGNTSGIVSCLRSINCEPNYHSLHINCGGRQVDNDNGPTYDDDANAGGPSNWYRSTNWARSSTGHFLDDRVSTDSYTVKNTSSISDKDSRLYMDARISPLSLTYYGFCLLNGNYTVDLHFAEIRITDDRTYGSLGRRIFDVYIQGNRVLKDFNIEDEAGGVNKGIKKNFPAIVMDNTLDIQFRWAGKGTTALPERGVYGPLISAISVNPDFEPPNGNGISAGAIVGIVIAVLFIASLVFGILWWKGCFERKDTLEYELRGVDLNTGSFTLRQIKAATNNFDLANKIGEGGFGPVYKGSLSDGTIIAVKQLSSKSKQGNREFVNVIGMISALQHSHLVKLYGCCIEGNQLLLVYEFLENNSLARALFGRAEHQLHLDWPTRHKICIGIARGLAYLHEESRLKIVHRDIKATNVLLDKNLNPKISDFGLAKLDEEDNTHISTRIAGTFGYMAPEYAMRGYLTDKADVYSFGIVLLEIVSGRNNTSIRPEEEPFYLLDWAHYLRENGDITELVDPRLESNFNKKEVTTTIKVAFHCTNAVAAERPNMSAVVSILDGRTGVQEFVSDSRTFWMNRVNRGEANGQDDVPKMNVEHSQSISMDVPWTNSSTSTSDLYPLTLDIDHWESRF